MALVVVILAAGKGTRMKSSLPKVLHPIAGKPMVAHIIETAESLNCKAINLVYGHQAQTLQQGLSDYSLNWCLQEQQLGTGHAVQQAIGNVQDDDDVMILVGDAPLISSTTLHNLLEVKKRADLALLTVNMASPTGMGRIIRHNGNITAIVEHKDATPDQLAITEINTGMMVMGGADLKRWIGQLSNSNAQAEYYLTDVIAMAAAEGKRIQAAHPEWEREVEGINNKAQLASLERAYQQRNAQAMLLDGVSLADPQRIDVRGSLHCGQDVSIDVNCVFEGEVRLGNNVSIGANCVLRNCSIGDNSVIEGFCHIDGADVAQACSVGPYARLRPAAQLQQGAKVGNFCEIKKATIGTGSKVNHLSYIGDAELGANVNIGAGTITCNYDGVNKSKTIIADKVFVGSNSSLVAPVNIGENATIGAGSTITKNVETEQLAVARGKQRNISGWDKPTKK